MMRSPRFAQAGALTALVVTSLVLTGCRQEQITSYQVPKEKPAQPAPAALPPMPKGHLDWTTLPDTWKEQPVTAPLRVANFSIEADGQTADVIVIPMPVAGHEIEFVNMWREQIQLPRIPPDEVAGVREAVKIGGLDGQLFDMVSDGPVQESKFKQRIVVAMTQSDGMSWFFKMTGDDELVAREKAALKTFMEDVAIHVDAMPADPHAGLNMGAARAPAPSGGAVTDTSKWPAPADWTPVDPGPVLMARFDLPGGGAQVTVSVAGGDLLSNVNRWRGQLQLQPITADALATVTSSMEIAGQQATVVDMTGAEDRLIAIIVPQGGQSRFYKSMGHPDVVEKNKEAFIEFARTTK